MNPEERHHGQIHLGDLIRALATLPWRGQDQAEAIAACLGFALRPHLAPSPSELPQRVFDRRGTTPAAESRSAAEPAARPPTFPPPPPRPAPLPEGTLPSRLTRRERLAPPDTGAPDWLAEAARDFPSRERAKALARATLLPERTARHVLSAALATQRAGADIDLPRLVDGVCRRQPLRTLPRHLEPTVASGCQLLLDYSASMVPYWEDLTALTAQVREVVGEQTTWVYSFDTRPSEARHWTTAGDARDWAPDGSPVLVATDLGIQGRADADPSPDWPKVAARCARAGNALMLLIPWPEARWPRTFPGNTSLIHWGPRTTAGIVRRQSPGARRR